MSKSLDAHVASLVNDAPELTSEQLSKLARILGGAA